MIFFFASTYYRFHHEKVGDWVRVKASVPSPKYGWEDVTRNSIGIIHSLEEDGDMGVAFCFRSKPFSCSVTDVEKLPPFEVGQEIHVLSSVTQPRLGWSNESPATVGRIDRIDMDGALNVRRLILHTHTHTYMIHMQYFARPFLAYNVQIIEPTRTTSIILFNTHLLLAYVIMCMNSNSN